MEFVTSLILFIVGFYILVRGARVLVNGSTSIAKIFNISTWFVGVVIVGFGTSIPEFSISIASVFNGNTIGMGTIIGTNIFNVLVILGLTALFFPITMKKQWVMKDFVINVGAVFAAVLVITLPLFGDQTFSGVTRDEGLFLVALLVAWLWFMFNRQVGEEGVADFKVFTIFTSVIMIIAGFVGVFVGGQWVVSGAKTLADLFGVSPNLVALTIVAVGTSLPEFAVSVTALFQRTVGIAVGNIIGSSILNFLGIIGVTALLRPIPIFESVRFDVIVALTVAILLFVVMFIGKRYLLSRAEGAFFVVSYVLYLVLIITRG